MASLSSKDADAHPSLLRLTLPIPCLNFHALLRPSNQPATRCNNKTICTWLFTSVGKHPIQHGPQTQSLRRRPRRPYACSNEAPNTPTYGRVLHGTTTAANASKAASLHTCGCEDHRVY